MVLLYILLRFVGYRLSESPISRLYETQQFGVKLELMEVNDSLFTFRIIEEML